MQDGWTAEVHISEDPHYDPDNEMDVLNGPYYVRVIMIPDENHIPKGYVAGRQVLESPFRSTTREQALDECLAIAEAIGAIPYHEYGPHGESRFEPILKVETEAVVC